MKSLLIFCLVCQIFSFFTSSVFAQEDNITIKKIQNAWNIVASFDLLIPYYGKKVLEKESMLLIDKNKKRYSMKSKMYYEIEFIIFDTLGQGYFEHRWKVGDDKRIIILSQPPYRKTPFTWELKGDTIIKKYIWTEVEVKGYKPRSYNTIHYGKILLLEKAYMIVGGFNKVVNSIDSKDSKIGAISVYRRADIAESEIDFFKDKEAIYKIAKQIVKEQYPDVEIIE